MSSYEQLVSRKATTYDLSDEDYDQINPDYLKLMDLKWNMTMIVRKIKKYMERASNDMPQKTLENVKKSDSTTMVSQAIDGVDWSCKLLGESSSDQQQVNMVVITKADQDEDDDDEKLQLVEKNDEFLKLLKFSF